MPVPGGDRATEQTADVATLDAVVARLQEVRLSAGQPSFGDVALRVGDVRRARGETPERARTGRTTVYDAFRTGRRRLNPELVADIVRALGGDEDLALELAAACVRAQATTPPDVRTEGSGPVETVRPIPSPSPDSGPAVAVEAPAEPPARAVVVLLVAGSVVVNLLGRGLVDLLGLPVYLDMVGTAFSAVVLGPWWGAAVGAATNGLGVLSSGPDSWWFLPVNVAGALVWGYGARQWGLGRSIPRFLALNLLAALVCTLLAAGIIVGAMGGHVGHGADAVTDRVLALGHSLWVAVGVANLLSSLADKLIAGFVSLAVVEALPAWARGWLPRGWMRGR